MSNNQKKWLNNSSSGNNNSNGSNSNTSNLNDSFSSSTSPTIGGVKFYDIKQANSQLQSHTPQIGSFTKNYELYSMNKIFSINSTPSSEKSNSLNQSGGNINTSNQFIHKQSNDGSGGGLLKRSNSNPKSLSDYSSSSSSSSSKQDEHHYNKYGVHTQSYQQQLLQQQLLQDQPTSIVLLAQGGSDDHFFTAMYCSNDYLIFRYVGQTKVPFYKCLKWDKDPNKRIVSMCFDPSAIWLLCLLNDTSCKVIPIYYDMCKKVGYMDDSNLDNNNNTGNSSTKDSKTNKPDLSFWKSTSKVIASRTGSSSSSTTSLSSALNKNSDTGNGHHSKFGLHSGKFKIPQLTKKTAMGSNCLWWKTSNSVDFAIITTTSNNIYFVNLVDSSIYKHRFEHQIEKIEMVQSESETFLLISSKHNGYFQLLIEQKIDQFRYETIIPPNLSLSSSSALSNNKSLSGSISSNDISNLSKSSDFNIKPLFNTDRNPSDRVLMVQKTNVNQQQSTDEDDDDYSNDGTSNSSGSNSQQTSPISSTSMYPSLFNLSNPLSISGGSLTNSSGIHNNSNSNKNENVVVSFLKSTSKLEIYEPLYLNKYPLFVYQLPSNTTNFFFTKHITIVSEQVNNEQSEQRSNILIISNLVAGTASNSKYVNNQSVMQTFQLSPGEVILGISKSLNHHPNNNNSSNNNNGQTNGNNNGFGKFTKLPTVSLWTNYAIYELRQKKSPEEIFFELVSCNLEKSDGEALGKTFRMDLLSCYETAADYSFDQGQYGRALDLYYLSGVRTNKLVFKFLEIGRMDIIMTHLKAILHQPDSFNPMDRKKISDILFQCYLQKLLTSKEDFKSLDAEFSNFLTSNQDYAVINALQLLSSNGLLEYFFAVAHSRKIMTTALSMLIESDILHLDAQNISFLQSAYSSEIKSHSNGMIFDCLPPNLQLKLIIEDPQTIHRYLRRLYHILPFLEEKDLLDMALTFDPLLFTPIGQINPKLNKTNPAVSHLHQIQQQQQLQYQQQYQQQYQLYQQQQQQHNNNSSNNMGTNILSNDDPELFENNSIPGRQSESIPIKDEEYFELYIIVLLSLIHLRRQKHHHHHHHHHHHRHHHHRNSIELNEKPIKDTTGGDSDNESEISTTNTTTTNTEDNISDDETSNKMKMKIDPELKRFPMTPLKNGEKKAIKVSCGWDHLAVITDDGELYTWGNNQSGQLGHGLEVNNKTLTSPKRVDFFRGKAIFMVECGGEHTIAVDSNYNVYSWGSDKYGQLGHGTKAVNLTKPKVIEELSGQKIQAIAAGFAHNVVLKKSGEMFSFGYGDFGQLGIGSFNSKNIPTRIEINAIVGGLQHDGGKITQIACGFGHSVICSENGEVYSWGLGKQGQLGHKNFENTARPRLIETLRGVTKISCGHFYTVATTDLKNVYSWGSGEHMKLGHGSDKDETVPRVVEFFIQKNVSKVVCGRNHTITLTFPDDLNNSNQDDEGDEENMNGKSSSPIYAWGSGEHGKLGLGGDLKSPFFDKPIPTAIKGVNSLNLIDISCGSDFTAMITSNNAVYVWGYGRSGQIGNGKNDDVWVPTRISLNDWSNKQSFNGLHQADNKKQRYSQEGLEEILRSHPNEYRPFQILNKAKQFENYDIVAVLYDIMKDQISTLEYKLLSLEKKDLEKEKEMYTLFSILTNYYIKDYEIYHQQKQIQLQQLQNQQQQQQQQNGTISPDNSNLTTPSSGNTPPMISTHSSPNLNSNKSDLSNNNNNNNINNNNTNNNNNNNNNELNDTIKKQEENNLLKYKLISMILNYWKKRSLPLNDLETFLLTNIDYFSETLAFTIQMNSSLQLPLLLEFSPLFYILTIKNYLQTLKNQSELDKRQQKVSEKVLWQNIKDNLEKNILQRSKIEIPTLNQDIYSSLTISPQHHISEKDIAFTCNHFFSKKNFYAKTLPEFKNESKKLSFFKDNQQNNNCSDTLDFIIQEFNKKSISQSCPVCLFNSLRDLQSDETKRDILKLFKLS